MPYLDWSISMLMHYFSMFFAAVPTSKQAQGMSLFSNRYDLLCSTSSIQAVRLDTNGKTLPWIKSGSPLLHLVCKYVCRE